MTYFFVFINEIHVCFFILILNLPFCCDLFEGMFFNDRLCWWQRWCLRWYNFFWLRNKRFRLFFINWGSRRALRWWLFRYFRSKRYRLNATNFDALFMNVPFRSHSKHKFSPKNIWSVTICVHLIRQKLLNPKISNFD